MTDSKDLTREHADSVRAMLADLWTAIDAGEPYDGSDDAREYLNDWPLEIVWEAGEPFAVVLGTGGPHVEITGGGRASGSGYMLSVYLGGNEVIVRGEGITRTGDYFRELVQS